MRPGPRAVALAAVTAVGIGLLGARAARAEEIAVPRAPRLFAAPTAWLPPASAVHATAGVDHRGGPFFAATAGLGGIAEVDATFSRLAGRLLPTALFKVGIGGRRVAAALGFRKSFGQDARAAQLFAVASVALGPVRLHAGVDRWDAQVAGGPEAAGPVRPLGGVEWTPAIFPKSTLIADLAWAARVDGATASFGWVGGGGVRYQALSWGAIELGVQVREGDGLERPVIFVRVNAALGH
jgi:hypothetical protein